MDIGGFFLMGNNGLRVGESVDEGLPRASGGSFSSALTEVVGEVSDAGAATLDMAGAPSMKMVVSAFSSKSEASISVDEAEAAKRNLSIGGSEDSFSEIALKDTAATVSAASLASILPPGELRMNAAQERLADADLQGEKLLAADMDAAAHEKSATSEPFEEAAAEQSDVNFPRFFASPALAAPDVLEGISQPSAEGDLRVDAAAILENVETLVEPDSMVFERAPSQMVEASLAFDVKTAVVAENVGSGAPFEERSSAVSSLTGSKESSSAAPANADVLETPPSRPEIFSGVTNRIRRAEGETLAGDGRNGVNGAGAGLALEASAKSAVDEDLKVAGFPVAKSGGVETGEKLAPPIPATKAVETPASPAPGAAGDDEGGVPGAVALAARVAAFGDSAKTGAVQVSASLSALSPAPASTLETSQHSFLHASFVKQIGVEENSAPVAVTPVPAQMKKGDADGGAAPLVGADIERRSVSGEGDVGGRAAEKSPANGRIALEATFVKAQASSLVSSVSGASMDAPAVLNGAGKYFFMNEEGGGATGGAVAKDAVGADVPTPAGAGKPVSGSARSGVANAALTFVSAMASGGAADDGGFQLDGENWDQTMQTDPARFARSVPQQNAVQNQNPALAAAAMAQVAKQLTQQSGKDSSQFHIRLDPAELGGVDVQMKIAQDGSVKAHLFIERSETLDMFMRDHRGLERALEAAGLKTEPGGLQFSLKDNGAHAGFGQGQQERQMNDQTRAALNEDAKRAGEMDELSQSQSLAGKTTVSGATGAVDIQI